MPSTKRKSDAINLTSSPGPSSPSEAPVASSSKELIKPPKHDKKDDEIQYHEDEEQDKDQVKDNEPKKKKAKTAAAPVKETKTEAKKRAKEERIRAELAEFDEACANDTVEIYDDCDGIRRKIRRLQKELGFKITHWLRDDVGGINNNSYRRFMAARGSRDGAGNGTYPAAYKYFERRRIHEGKPKTVTRLDNEIDGPFSTEISRRQSYVVPAWWGPAELLACGLDPRYELGKHYFGRIGPMGVLPLCTMET